MGVAGMLRALAGTKVFEQIQKGGWVWGSPQYWNEGESGAELRFAGDWMELSGPDGAERTGWSGGEGLDEEEGS